MSSSPRPAGPRFSGVLTALVTPFRDGEIDEAAFRALVERQIAAGIDGLVPVGTTGETATLTHDEHKRVVELCVEIAAGRVAVVAGAGSNSTAEAVELVRHAQTVGADGALVVTPYYNRPSQEGLYRHYAEIASGSDLPVLIYNVPGRTAVDISNETVVRLAQIPSMVGVKDATADLLRMSLMRLACPEGFILLSGDDGSALGYIAQGGHGVISVTSNVAPGPMAQMIGAARSGDFAAALRLNDRLAPLHKGLFLDASPAPAKFALAELGLCLEDVRLPLRPCAEAVRPKVLEAMRAAGL
ncbi:4-hydroxy-tetrahydrodipicolinate synthase [soil metagenome]